MARHPVQVCPKAVDVRMGSDMLEGDWDLAILDKMEDFAIALVLVEQMVNDVLVPCLIVNHISITRVIPELLWDLDWNGPVHAAPRLHVRVFNPPGILGDQVSSS